MANNQAEDDWDALLQATAAFQRLIPDAVLVGGTAAAVHAKHRLSTDADLTLSDLRNRFAELLERLQSSSDWELDRRNAPVMIMGSFKGVETTLRQLIRVKPLDVETVSSRGHSVVVPTVPEMIRIKGWLSLTRNSFRDYLDLAALTCHFGDQPTVSALENFDECYKDVPHRKVAKDVSPLIQLARQLADPRPADLRDVGEVASYKGIVGQWNSWDKVCEQCRHAGVLATNAALNNHPRIVAEVSADSTTIPSAPPYPNGTHKAFLLSDGQTVVIREKDTHSGDFYKIGNTDGPAIVGNGQEVYVVHGERMDKDKWLQHPEVQQALQPKS